MSDIFVTPSVTLLGSTTPTEFVEDFLDPTESNLGVSEFGGRACYQSFGKPNPATADTDDYIRNIIRQGHESVLEHTVVTLYIQGISRSVSHEMIRHRHLSPSQLSQRYVDAEDMKIALHPTLRNDVYVKSLLLKEFNSELETYRSLVDDLEEQGYSRKQAREAAREVLPNCTETRIVLTGNLRAWRDMLKQRLSPHADAFIREVAQKIFEELQYNYPVIMEDLQELYKEGLNA